MKIIRLCDGIAVAIRLAMHNHDNARLSSIELRQRRSRVRDLLFAACVAGTAITALLFL